MTLFQQSPPDNRYWMFKPSRNDALSTMRLYLQTVGCTEETYGQVMRMVEHCIKTEKSTPWTHQFPFQVQKQLQIIDNYMGNEMRNQF